MPEDATVEDIEQLHLDAWKLGIKAVAIYRDNCKVAQPLQTMKKGDNLNDAPVAVGENPVVADLQAQVSRLEKELAVAKVNDGAILVGAVRERLPRKRTSTTFSFRVADCEGYVTIGEYEDGRPGELFVKVSKQGSTLAGIMDAFSIAVSLGLQHGVPLSTYVRKYANMKFEPSGMTDDPDLRIATSLVDYIFRRLALDYLSTTEREDLGILSVGERIQPTLPTIAEQATVNRNLESAPVVETKPVAVTPKAETIARAPQSDAPMCYSCGNSMQRAGSCYVCSSCGATSGCS